MKYRKFGKSELNVSEIGFGAWSIGGGWGNQDDTEAVHALNLAFDNGINFFDTAMAYGDGHSEELIGKTFKGRRHHIVIATKISPKDLRWPGLENENPDKKFPADWIISCTEKSLKRLRTDFIDVQQLHCWAASWQDQGDWLEAAARLKQAGKIACFGVSANDWEPYNTVSLIESDLIDSVQVIYNLFEQRPRERLLPAAQKHKVGIIVRVPFDEGLLTGKFKPGFKWAKDDWRKDWMTEDRLREVEPRLEALSKELDDNYQHLSGLALKFTLSHPAVCTTIPGMRTRQHVKLNAPVSDLPDFSQKKLERLYQHQWIHGWKYPWHESAE